MKGVTRREAIIGLLATSAFACASIPRYAARDLPLRIPLAELGEHDRLIVDHRSLPYPILVSRIDAELIAVRMECTHAGCPLNARRTGLVCHCHGSRFNDEGEVLEGPAEQPLTRYPTRLEVDVLIIDL